MFKHLSRKANQIALYLIVITVNLSLDQIFGNAQIIRVDPSAIRISSINTASNFTSSNASKQVSQVKRDDLQYSISNKSSNQASSRNISNLGNFDRNLSSNQSFSTGFDQFIVPMSNSWSSYGDLTLSVLASDDFYTGTQKSLQKNNTENNKSSKDTELTSFSSTKNISQQVSNTSRSISNDNSNNSIMNESQLKSLESQLVRVKQRSSNVAQNGIQSRITNSQLSPIIYRKAYQEIATTPSNVGSSPSSSFDFSSNSQGRAKNNNLLIENMKNTVNQRFNSFLYP